MKHRIYIYFVNNESWSHRTLRNYITYSYCNNPALGDADSLEVEMVLMRHVTREMEADMKLIQGKVGFIVNVMIVHV